MQRAWDELTANWNRASSTATWGTAGASNAADRSSTVLGSITASSKGLNQIVLNAAGIAAVQNWINNPASNFGFIIQDYGNSSGADISSSEASTATQRPKLTITYRPANDGGGTQQLVVEEPETPPPPVNVAPLVTAGADQTIQLPNGAALSGTVTDDGQPGESLARGWTKVSGPGTVSFVNSGAASTTATFGLPGTYVLRLTASDGELSSFDDVTIVVNAAAPVNQPPVVNAGADQTVQLPSAALLSASVNDAGGPLASPQLTWTRVSGPGNVTFVNASSSSTSASFTAAGTYVLRLTANDGQYSSFDEVTIVVLAEPEPAPEPAPPQESVGNRLVNARRKLRG
jgi:hypothetical protein